MYKIIHGQAPEYLNSLLPDYITNRTPYPLRNQQNIDVPFARIDAYYYSFFPCTIRDWNGLNLNTRNLVTIKEFKTVLNVNSMKCNKLFYVGNRVESVHHARLRIGCSLLNADLCNNLHVRDDPDCSCGDSVEDAYHFFLTCPRYRNERVNLINTISPLAPCSLNVLLYGDREVTEENNKKIFEAVHKYIIDSRRFDL